MSEGGESSSQALERYLKQQLEELKIQVPEDDLEMMARFVEEEGLEKDEKIEGVRAMLEGMVEVSQRFTPLLILSLQTGPRSLTYGDCVLFLDWIELAK